MKDIELIREAADIIGAAGYMQPRHVGLLRALADRLEAQKPAAWKYQNAYHGNQWFFTAHQTDLATYNAMNVKPLFTYPPDAQAKIAELEADNARLIREMLVLSVDHEIQLAEYKADAERYQRTRILGVIINAETPLLRFTNLDQFIDRDIKVNPSRGEFKGGKNV